MAETQGEIRYGMSIEGTDQALAATGSKMLAWGKNIASILGVMIGASLFSEGFDELMSLEESLRQIDIITGGKEDIEELQDAVEQLSVAMGVSADEISNAFYQAISAGFGWEEAWDLTRVASELAAVGAASGEVVSTTEAIDVLTSVINAYGGTAEDATRYAELLFQSVISGKTSMGEMAGSISATVAIASSLGVAFEDVMIVLDALTQQGLQTSEAMVGMKAILNEMLTPADDLKDVMEDLGSESAADLFEMYGGFIPVMQALEEQIEIQNLGWEDLFGNVRSISSIMALATDDFALATEATDAMTNSVGSLDSGMSTWSENTATQWDQAMQSISVSVMNLIDLIGGAQGLIWVISVLATVISTAMVLSLVKVTYKLGVLIAQLISAIVAAATLKAILTGFAFLAVLGGIAVGAYYLQDYLSSALDVIPQEDLDTSSSGGSAPLVETTTNVSVETTVDPISGTTTNSTSSNTQTNY